jgi:hypothetical protein
LSAKQLQGVSCRKATRQKAQHAQVQNTREFDAKAERYRDRCAA